MGAPAPAAQPYMPNTFDGQPQQYGADAFANIAPQQPQYNYNPSNTQAPQQYPSGYTNFNPQSTPNTMPPQQQSQFGMFQQPIVQDMAMQYGQKLADQGKQIVESHFEKYVPVTRLKYYFAVDNKYVINKLRLLFFPFAHSVSFTTFMPTIMPKMSMRLFAFPFIGLVSEIRSR